MKRKLLCVLLLALMLLPASSPARAQARGQQAGTKATLTWQLSNARVISAGQTSSMPEGTLLTGYVIEADAKSKTNPLINLGKFQMTLTVFSPNADMPGQQAGMWYVSGNWTITDTRAPKQAKKVRHDPAVLGGWLTAELSFNPTTVADKQTQIAAQATLPMSLAAGRWAKGSGTFSGNVLFEGSLVLEASLGLAIKGRQP